MVVRLLRMQKHGTRSGISDHEYEAKSYGLYTEDVAKAPRMPSVFCHFFDLIRIVIQP
jgi:hypothetical protein